MERRSGPAACTCTPHYLSGQARAASETFSEHTSSSTQGTSATSTMVKLGLFRNCYGTANFMFKGSEPKQVSVFSDHIVVQFRDYA